MSNHDTLDPDDWDNHRSIGHKMIDDMFTYLREIGSRPVWLKPPDSHKELFNSRLPWEPQPLQEIYDDVKSKIIPYILKNNHPRFMGWVMGNGTPTGMLAEMLAAGLNTNAVGGVHSASHVENQTLKWLKEIIGMPAESSGVLISGGSMANFIGLSVAINSKMGSTFGKGGLQNSSRNLCFYASTETHDSIKKAIRILGIGTDYLRLIEVNDQFEIDTGSLEKSIQDDLEAGRTPCCIVGTAGTVNTGAIDNLWQLSRISRLYDTWLHIDGAIGAGLCMNQDLRFLVDGIETADSIALDLHKWVHVPYEVGCCLVKNAKIHQESFAIDSDYLEITKRGYSAGDDWYCDYGLELSRGFKALKIWITFKEFGIHKFGRIIKQNIDQANYLASLINQDPNFELLAPVNLHIVCFRFTNGNSDKLDTLNEELMLRIQERGLFMTSYTKLKGKFAIRVCISNHRTVRMDIDDFMKELNIVVLDIESKL